MALGSSTYKVILLGEPGVGKTSFFLRIREGRFVDRESVTVTADVCDKTVRLEGSDSDSTIQASLYDTAGGERFRTLTSNFYMNADAGILMFSVEDRYTLDRLHEEVENASRFIDMDNFVWAVVGNKCDMPCEIDDDLIKARCETLDTDLLFFTSAKTGLNVTKAFEEVIQRVHQRKCRADSRGRSAERGHSIHVKISPASSKHTCCYRH